jgi:hypothetical protein
MRVVLTRDSRGRWILERDGHKPLYFINDSAACHFLQVELEMTHEDAWLSMMCAESTGFCGIDVIEESAA